MQRLFQDVHRMEQGQKQVDLEALSQRCAQQCRIDHLSTSMLLFSSLQSLLCNLLYEALHRVCNKVCIAYSMGNHSASIEFYQPIKRNRTAVQAVALPLYQSKSAHAHLYQQLRQLEVTFSAVQVWNRHKLAGQSDPF